MKACADKGPKLLAFRHAGFTAHGPADRERHWLERGFQDLPRLQKKKGIVVGVSLVEIRKQSGQHESNAGNRQFERSTPSPLNAL